MDVISKIEYNHNNNMTRFNNLPKELRDMILLTMHPKDLFRSKRVCKEFHDTIRHANPAYYTFIDMNDELDVKELLELGYPEIFANCKNAIPLNVACFYGLEIMVKALLNFMKPNEMDNPLMDIENVNTFTCALMSGNLNIIDMIIDKINYIQYITRSRWQFNMSVATYDHLCKRFPETGEIAGRTIFDQTLSAGNYNLAIRLKHKWRSYLKFIITENIGSFNMPYRASTEYIKDKIALMDTFVPHNVTDRAVNPRWVAHDDMPLLFMVFAYRLALFPGAIEYALKRGVDPEELIAKAPPQAIKLCHNIVRSNLLITGSVAL